MTPFMRWAVFLKKEMLPLLKELSVDWFSSYLLRGIFMSTWGFLPAVFRPFRTVFPGLGAGFLNLAGKMERTAKKWEKTGEKWARNGLKRVGVS